MSKKTILFSAIVALAITVFTTPAYADAQKMVIDLNLTDANGIGAAVGTVTLEDTEYGLLLTSELTDLVPGVHGFHVHTNPDCDPAMKDGKAVPGLLEF